MLRHAVRLFCILPLAVSALASCGGSTFQGDSAGGSGSGASAGSNGHAGTGGGTSSGGSGTGGGYGTGGTSTGAAAGTSSSGGSGVAGTGGVLPDLCSLPADGGLCDAYIPSYFHNPVTGVCEPFVYGGCGGNDNRFDTVEACVQACHGGAPDLDACQQNSDCVLVDTACCPSCTPDINEFVAINSQYQDKYLSGRVCPEIACSPCPVPGPGQNPAAYFIASCEAGQCVPVDLRTTKVTACSGPDQCMLRDGGNCCEGCGGDDGNWISISSPEILLDMVCDSNGTACLACAPIPPTDMFPTCTDGVCDIEFAL